MIVWSWLRDSSLVIGPLPTTISVAGLLGLVTLVARRGGRWWLRWVPVAVGAGGLAGWGLVLVKPFPDVLPMRVVAWVGVAATAVVLAVGGLRRPARWWRRALIPPALLLVVATGMVKVNAVYQYRPTVADAFGLSIADEIPLDAVPRQVGTAPAVGPDAALADGWRPPPDMPRAGKVARVDIPGTTSGFAARPGWVYLPPAYLTARRPLLPTLVLMAGQPGWPADWLTAGHLAELMDRFAARHAGLAPVVVVPDATGSPLDDPLCLDSALGRVQTYLASDVPAWVAGALQVDTDRRHWAIGGFSYGGTCALQLAVNAPATYPTFVDISGDDEPSLGTRAETVAAAFGGDDAAFRAVNPLDVLARGRFPAGAGRLVVGRKDLDSRDQAGRVLAAARAAGMDVGTDLVPGAHTWAVATAGLDGELEWLAGRLGLTAPAARSRPAAREPAGPTVLLAAPSTPRAHHGRVR